MKLNRLGLAAAALVAAGVFYWVYRPPATLSNRLVGWLLGQARADEAKAWLTARLPELDGLKGCLPSGLWVLAAVCVVGGRGGEGWSGPRVVLALAPMAINALWEGVQWAGLTDGRADIADVAAGCAGWAVAVMMPLAERPREERWDGWRDWRLAALGGAWALIGLADVL